MGLAQRAARIGRQRGIPIAPRLRGDSTPAPVLGWNQKDPLDGMKEGFAPRLDNFFPRGRYCEVRGGNSEFATGMGSGVVESVMEFAAGSTKQMIAGANGALYNATTSGAVGAALASGFSVNRWQETMFKAKLFIVNGTDAPQDWDGSTMTATSWSGSGLTITDLINVHVFKQRLYFAEKNSANFWYGASSAVTGTLTEFQLDEVFPSGGNLVAINTITLDGGNGPDDLIAFVMESGHIIIYAGTDPGDATAWSLVGIFKIGFPVGRRPLLRLGSDLIAITPDGYIPILPFLKTGRRKEKTILAISDNISGAVSEAVKVLSGNFGWEALLYPKGNMLIFNVPQVEGGQAFQHVQNTQTGAWCRFKGMDAQTWLHFSENLYFGGTDGKTYKADDTLADNGSNIEADGSTSYKYYGGRGRLKKFPFMRPIMGSDAALPVGIGMGVDFEEVIPTVTASLVTSAGSLWDVAAWDVAAWGGEVAIDKSWRAANREGYSASIRVRTATKAQQVRWYSNDVLFEIGDFI